jgi:hypothetical protein
MTQVTNVLFILIVTVLFSVIATFFLIFLDNIVDIRAFISNIPRLFVYNWFI